MTRQEIVERVEATPRDKQERGSRVASHLDKFVDGSEAWNRHVARIVCTILGINEGDDK